jgi:expansin (peptidoglycan-binding protein)
MAYSSLSHPSFSLTYFYQNGVAGACGTVHSDSDFVAALDSSTYGDTGSQSSYCGKTIRVTWQDKSVDVVVADACPTCANPSSVDLSVAAFQALAPLAQGELDGGKYPRR